MQVIIVAGIAFLLQGVLSTLQMKHLNDEFLTLRRRGKVAFGRKSGGFHAGAIVMFLIKRSLAGLFGAHFAGVFYLLSWIMMGIALVLTIVSLVDYFYKARYLLGFAKPEETTEGTKGERGEAAGELSLSIAAEDLDGACRDLSAEVIARAKAQGKTVSTCESLTGGLIGAYLTGVPGSSAVVSGGLITYTEGTKASLAGVSEARLAETGPVDDVVAEQMAAGSRRECASDVAVAVTGIAGPTGDEPGKPVGTVYFGVCTAQGTASRRMQFPGDRDEVRLRTVLFALELLLGGLREDS